MKRKRQSSSQATRRRALLWTRADVLCVFAVALVCAAVYAQTWGYDFVHLDDPRLVTRNPMVSGGFSWEGLRWSFTMQQDPNFMPLTWMSHMLDCQLFGLRPGAHHLMSVVYHTVSSILLFLVLLYMTGARGPSLFTAAVFAVHPLHVESVAWISERKDVLCGGAANVGETWWAGGSQRSKTMMGRGMRWTRKARAVRDVRAKAKWIVATS